MHEKNHKALTRASLFVFAVIATGILIASNIAMIMFYSNSTTAVSFASTKSAINSAFSSTYEASMSGENTTLLVNKLNMALAFFEKAQVENSTNPSQAIFDLQNATSIATQVSSMAESLSNQGMVATRVHQEVSAAEVVAILVLSSLICIYYDLFYNFFWLILYRNYKVTRSKK